MSNLVGLLGIEPSLHAPKACVLPVYYSPASVLRFRSGQVAQRIIPKIVSPGGIEPPLRD